MNCRDSKTDPYYLPRFIETDPTGFDAGDMNFFRYCGDDPVDKTDPTGLIANIAADRMWITACFFDSGNSFQGSYGEYMGYRPQAGMGATVTGQSSRPGPKEPVGRGSRAPSESDEPLRMLPPEEATSEGYGRDAYYQFANHDGKPLSGGNLRFQESTKKDPNNTFDIETSDKKPPRELIHGGLFKDHIGFKFRPEGRPPGTATLYQNFKSFYPDGKAGPSISTQFKHVTTLHPDRTVTNSVYVIDP